MSITTYIAIWGAGLSTFVVVRDWYRLRARARVRVGYTAVSTGNRTAMSGFVLAATISNHGREPIFLSTAGAQADNGTSMSGQQFVASPSLPCELRPGQSYTAHFDAEQIWAMGSYGERRCVRIVYHDQMGRRYESPFVGVGKPVKEEDSSWSLNPAEDVPRNAITQWWMSRRLPGGSSVR